MTFRRTKRITKSGRTYVYSYLQRNQRINGKVKSFHIKVGDGHVPALLEDAWTDEFNAKEKAASKETATPASSEQPSMSEATTGAASTDSPGEGQ
jgi:hypothetical protein